MQAIKIKPRLAYRHAGYPESAALDPNKVYVATIATNQPNYKERGLVFVNPPSGPELLLDAEDYDAVTNHRRPRP